MLSREGSIQWVMSCGGVFSGPDSNFETIDLPIYIYIIYIIYILYIILYIEIKALMLCGWSGHHSYIAREE